MKNYILLFISFFFLISCKKTIGEKIGNSLDRKQIQEINLSDYTDFDWDYVWICQTMYRNKFDSIVKEKNINIDYFKPNMWGESPDFNMVFFNKGKVVYLDSPPYVGSGIDVMELYSFMPDEDGLAKKYSLYPKSKAKFKADGRTFKGDAYPDNYSLRPIYPSMEADSLPVYP